MIRSGSGPVAIKCEHTIDGKSVVATFEVGDSCPVCDELQSSCDLIEEQTKAIKTLAKIMVACCLMSGDLEQAEHLGGRKAAAYCINDALARFKNDVQPLMTSLVEGKVTHEG